MPGVLNFFGQLRVMQQGAQGCQGRGFNTYRDPGLLAFGAAIIGADRIAANGDAANKVGSVALALACARAGLPFVVAAPFSTVDLATASGDDIVIEERSGDEVLVVGGVRMAPEGARGFNPAFDVTPHDLVSAVVTERGMRHIIDCVAAMKRQRGEQVAQDLAARVVEVFEKYRDLFFRPYGEGSMRWALQPGVA